MKPLTRKTKRQPERVFNHPELSERVNMAQMANNIKPIKTNKNGTH